MNIKELHNLFLKSFGVTTDSRQIELNSIFFALKGDNFDGNKYAKSAIDKGASFAVVDNQAYCLNEKYILVDDVLSLSFSTPFIIVNYIFYVHLLYLTLYLLSYYI